MSSRIHVDRLGPTAADDPETMSALSDLVNKVYAAAEEGLWLDGAARTGDATVPEASHHKLEARA